METKKFTSSGEWQNPDEAKAALCADGGWPAFPFHAQNGGPIQASGGVTPRQYAAIKLRVPDSGTDWLDDMIRQSLRDEFAAKAMQGSTAYAGLPQTRAYQRNAAEYAYLLADAMLEARG